MNRRFNRKLLLLPIIASLVGIGYVFVIVHGLNATWSKIGHPTEEIAEILGHDGQWNLFVNTTSGKVFSINFRSYTFDHKTFFTDSVMGTMPDLNWKSENIQTLFLVPPLPSSFEFISWPLLFKEKQLYSTSYQYTEGETLIKFALSNDRNLWIWSYGVGGMTGFLYLFCPPIGFILGILLIFIVKDWNVEPIKP